MKPLEGVRIDADWLKTRELQKLFDILNEGDGKAMVSGGAVRNTLMNLPASDVDLATTLLPDEVMHRVEEAGLKAVPTGIKHGTVTVVIDGIAFEVTTLREDIETDGRHAVVRFGTDWQADALRRDLTINGMFCDREGSVFDFVGGYADIERGVVRFIGEADTRIKEDALRILRFFRFFAWYGSGRPDASGLKASSANRDLVSGLSAERIWMEFRKLLAANDPSRALLWMRTTGVLSQVLPESENWGIDAIPILIRCEAGEGWEVDPLLRLMAMIRPHLETVTSLATRLKFSKAEAARLLAWAKSPKLDADTDIGTLQKMLYRHDPQGILDAMRLETALLQGRDEMDASRKMAALAGEASKWQNPEFPVQGQDLLDRGLQPGKDLGNTLKTLEDRWVESGFELSREELLSDY